MKGRLHHIDLTVTNLEASTRFYDFCLSEMGFRRMGDLQEGPLWAGDGLEVGLQASKAGGATTGMRPGFTTWHFGRIHVKR